MKYLFNCHFTIWISRASYPIWYFGNFYFLLCGAKGCLMCWLIYFLSLFFLSTNHCTPLTILKLKWSRSSVVFSILWTGAQRKHYQEIIGSSFSPGELISVGLEMSCNFRPIWRLAPLCGISIGTSYMHGISTGLYLFQEWEYMVLLALISFMGTGYIHIIHKTPQFCSVPNILL